MKDKNKKLDSIKENTPKLNYFLKNVQVSSKKAKTEIPEIIKPKTDAAVDSPVKKKSEVKVNNKADYHDSTFKKTLTDIQSKVNSLVMKKDRGDRFHNNSEVKVVNNKETTNNSSITRENAKKESFLPVVDKLKTISNNTKKTIIQNKEKTIPQTTVVRDEGDRVGSNTVINNETTKIMPEKTVINNETTKIMPEKTVINNETTKMVESPAKNKKDVVVRDSKPRIIPQKAESEQKTSSKTENKISNTLNRIEKLNQNTNSRVNLHGIVDNSKDSIKNVLKKSVLLHNHVNKNNISNTNYENVSKVVNSKSLKSVNPNISTVLTKESKIPSLAEGGYVEEPTVAQVGDAKTTSGKKEGEMVIAPSKLPEILAETNVIEKTENRIQRVSEIKESPTKGLSEMANESLQVNADRRTTQQASTITNAENLPSAPLIINQAGSQTQATPPTASQGGQKLAMNDVMNVALPRWRSKMG